MLLKEPILKYPDPSKPYTLFTDASKYAWACVLTQEYEHEFDGKVKKILHPITNVSGLFKGSQVNWATLTKEAYAIYMSVKKLPYYLQDADIILRSDHLPLKKFLSKNTLNTKVRASSSYFFLFFPIFLSILLFFLFFSNFLLFFLFFSHFTYSKQIFVRYLKNLSLFKYVVYRVQFFFFHKIVFIMPEMFVLIINKV